MTKSEQKQYIKQVWNLSSGKKIAEMLKRYWNVEKTDEKLKNELVKQDELVETAKELFT